MLIDWFTVGAQTLNFLILVWLLKRFLYKPILDAIDAREKRIGLQIENANADQAKARQERIEFQDKNGQFEQQRADMLARATQEAKAEGQRLVDEARQAAEALRASRLEALRAEQQRLADALTRRTSEEVMAIVGKTLTDLADTTLEARICAVFLQRLHDLDAASKAAFAQALGGISTPAILRSAFELAPEQRAMLLQAVNTAFGAEVRLGFETGSDLIGGMELSAGGQKLAWNIRDYLGSLAESIDTLLEGASVPVSPNTQ